MPGLGDSAGHPSRGPLVAAGRYSDSFRACSGSQVGLVRGCGQAIPKTVVEARYYLISPAFDGLELDPRTLDWCVRLVKENPPWRLSVQMHKFWGVR